MPAPKAFINLPDVSKCRMGSTFESTQLLAPHLSYAQIVPSGATSTPAVEPHFLPSGSWPKLTPGGNGFGSLLVGA